MPYYQNPVQAGLDKVINLNDGQTITIKWFKAYPSVFSNKIAYHIYYSTIKENVYSEGVKYISVDDALEANIIDLTPGQNYYFSVRPVEYNSSIFNVDLLPVAYDNLRVYATSLLRSNITATDLIIPLLDVTGFTPTGVIRVGVEEISYSSIDNINNNLILSDISQRGSYLSQARSHTVAGFDGLHTWSPIITQLLEEESNIFDRIFVCQCRFDYPQVPFTIADGYHQVTKDLLSTDLSASDASNVDFPMYDYAGYHRVDPVLLLSGACVGSYIGGEYGCIDGYGNYNIVRGLNLQDKNTQRQEIELSLDGVPAVLIQRQWTGITCPCYLASSEYPDDRCPYCLGTKFLLGYQQYFNPRRSDGRILVRPSPTEENLKMYEAGLESEYPLNLWTLTVPTIKTRDILVMFDIDDNEEFRYEVMGVTRNKTLLNQQGGQQFRVTRIRKTDPAYQIRVFRNTSSFPSKLITTAGMAIPGIPSHTHEITRNEQDPSKWSQITSTNVGHNHPVIIQNGIPMIMEVLKHTHQIVIT